MANYTKRKIFFIVCGGVEISITATPNRIIALEEYLSDLQIPKQGIYYLPDFQDFVKIQRKFEDIIRE